MMGIGPGEMILIAGIALVVIGPERFPEFAKIVVRTFRDLRGYVDDVKGELQKELKPVKKEIDDVSRYKPEDYIDALTDGSSEESDYDEVNDPYGYGSEYGDEYGYGTTETQGPSEPASASSGEDATSTEDAPSGEEKASAEAVSGEQEELGATDDTDWSEFADHAPEDPTAADEAQEKARPGSEPPTTDASESAKADEPDTDTPPDRLDG